MKHHIDDGFIHQLFSHPTFQLKLKKTQQNHSQKKAPTIPQVQNLVEQICGILSEEFKYKMDSECMSIYQSHLQIIKQMEQVKNNIFALSPTKTEVSSFKNLNNSILSEMEMDMEGKASSIRKQPQEIRAKAANTSFMQSFLFQNEMKQSKEELEERINATIINLSGDVAKFESSVQERMRNVENSLNRKMESIYKTLTSILETINELQTKFSQFKQNKDFNRKDLDKAFQMKGGQKMNKQKSYEIGKESENNGRRRSFLGFLKY